MAIKTNDPDEEQLESIGDQPPTKIVNLMQRNKRFMNLARKLNNQAHYMKALDDKIKQRK